MKSVLAIIAAAVAAIVIGSFVYSSLHDTMQVIHTALSFEVTK
ncbi:hypothetical protein [Burkholderia ambifaria]|nr:hypothetical protein [Burkholderia ambifaria]